jgi:hypothetical protein
MSGALRVLGYSRGSRAVWSIALILRTFIELCWSFWGSVEEMRVAMLW